MNLFVIIALGSGLAGACAFRLFFPFILTSIFVRYTAIIEFPLALRWLSSTPILMILLIGMVLEFLLDYFPGISFFHTSMYSALKIFAGATIFTLIVGWNPWIGILVGGLITGFLNVGHLVLAPFVERQQHYFSRLEYPIIENLMSIVLTILALTAPLLSLLATGLLVYSTIRVGRNVV